MVIDFGEFSRSDAGTTDAPVTAQEQRRYKYKIDKRLLRECLVSDNADSRCILELNKLVDTIFNKHFSKYVYMKEDLACDAVAAVYSKRSYYEPSRDAYNFLYAVIRNEIGNKILKYTKETLIEDYADYCNSSAGNKVDFYEDIPKRAAKYFDDLVGDSDSNYTVIERRDVPDLLLYLKLNERKSRVHEAPEYVELSQHTLNVMYELIRLIL